MKIIENYYDFLDSEENYHNFLDSEESNIPELIDNNHNSITRAKFLNFNELKDLLNKNCKYFLSKYKENNKYLFFRGIENDIYNYGLIEPSKNTRVNKYGNLGFYSIIMNDSIFWSKYPKRNKSIFFLNYNNKIEAMTYGNLYVIIPYDNSTIACATTKDVWDSFNILGLSCIEFDKILMSIGIKNKTDFKKLNIDYLKNYLNIKEIKLLHDECVKNNLTPQKYLEEILKPTNNGFTLRKIEQIRDINIVNGELWTDDNCLLIKWSEFIKIKNKI